MSSQNPLVQGDFGPLINGAYRDAVLLAAGIAEQQAVTATRDLIITYLST